MGEWPLATTVADLVGRLSWTEYWLSVRIVALWTDVLGLLWGTILVISFSKTNIWQFLVLNLITWTEPTSLELVICPPPPLFPRSKMHIVIFAFNLIYCYHLSWSTKHNLQVTTNILACMKQVLEMISNPHYLYRMTILHAISLLAPVMGSEITRSELLPIVITASKDRYFSFFSVIMVKSNVLITFLTAACCIPCRVPNIKFNVAKVLESIFPIVDQSVSN